jgi:cytochrome P450
MALMAQAQVAEAVDAERRARFPLGAALAFEDLDEAGREGALDALREAEPVSWVPALGGFLVTGHALAREALAPRTPMTVEVQENLVRASLGAMMLTSDGDEHERLRAPFERPFRMRGVDALFGAAITAEAATLLDALAPSGACELGTAFAAPFAIRMAGRVLGLSLGDVSRIDEFYGAFAGAMVYDGDPEPQRRADAARAELDAILAHEIARCRAEPDGSVTSSVANDAEAGLTDDEVASQLRVVMFGAIETVQASVLNTVLLLLRHPAALADVRADPELLPGAIAEAMRLVPPVAFIERWTAAPVTLGGVELGPGEFVGVSVVAANRDPAVFADPLRFDLRRANARHGLGFSFGVHHCIGVHLARLETLVAVRGLLERLDGLELVGCEEPGGFAFRKPARLDVRWRAAAS